MFSITKDLVFGKLINYIEVFTWLNDLLQVKVLFYMSVYSASLTDRKLGSLLIYTFQDTVYGYTEE